MLSISWHGASDAPVNQILKLASISTAKYWVGGRFRSRNWTHPEMKKIQGGKQKYSRSIAHTR